MRIVVRNTSNQEEQEYKNWAEVGRAIIKTNTPRSEDTTRTAIEKLGWEVVLVEGKRETSKTAFDIINKLESLLKVVDKEQVKKLENERNNIVKTAKTSKDFNKLIDINEKIEQLMNPSITLDAMLEYITTQYNNKHENEIQDITSPSEEA